MTCEACAARSTNPLSGLYHLDCLDCCARLVVSARPSRRQQEAMLQLIESGRDRPTREAVVARVRELAG